MKQQRSGIFWDFISNNIEIVKILVEIGNIC